MCVLYGGSRACVYDDGGLLLLRCFAVLLRECVSIFVCISSSLWVSVEDRSSGHRGA